MIPALFQRMRLAPYEGCAVQDGRMCGTCLGSAQKGLSSADFAALIETHGPSRRAAEFFGISREKLDERR